MTRRPEPLPLIDRIIIDLIEEHDAVGKRRPSYLALSYATGLSEGIIGRVMKRLLADRVIAPPKKKPTPKPRPAPFTTLEALKQRDAKIRRELIKQRADEVRRKGFTRPSITACRDIDPLATMLRRAAVHQRKTV